MSYFEYRAGRLHAESVDLLSLAQTVGTPAYVYSRRAIEDVWHAYDQGLGDHPHLVCYAMKANSNLAILDLLARLGSGFDIVSGGELERVLAVGGQPDKVVFSGVGKTVAEMERALEVGIRCFNTESIPELERLDAVAGRMGKRAAVSLRVNPDVDPQTHPYIATGLKDSKFGVPIDDAVPVYRRAASMANIDIVGVDCHIGSQLTSMAPVSDAVNRVLELVDALAAERINVSHIDVGGGLGIQYRDEMPPSAHEYAKTVRALIEPRALEIVLEPGRSVVGNAGVLLMRVEYVKRTNEKTFAIVDAAMNDYIRPALYSAWCDIVPVLESERASTQGSGPDVDQVSNGVESFDIVGPVCESGDFLGWARPLAVTAGSYLALCSAGAYGFVMSSNYNSRPRAVEVLVDGDEGHIVRPRETIQDLFASETTLPSGGHTARVMREEI
ncbi:MAG: diaminopimelate decarboxylase [Gammaproteobacteria bacterium]|jgi:diaminopimelate decarboxylase